MREPIKQENLRGISLASFRTGVRNVLNFRASFMAGSRFSSVSLVPEVVSQMLELGTTKHSKEEIVNILESNAISLDMSADETRLNIKASLPSEKAQLFVTLLSEILRTPKFAENELTFLSKRLEAGLLEVKQDTRTQAWKHLLRSIYPGEHPFYQETEEKDIMSLKSLKRENLMEFHAKHYGLGNVNIALAGDVDHEMWSGLINKFFGDWQLLSNMPVSAKTKSDLKTRKNIFISGKASADLFMGQILDLDVLSRDYFAIRPATYVLGGDFVSRLMQEVREKRGLTYGTNASHFGIKDGDTGLFYLWGTFAPHLLERGIAEMRKVFEIWTKKGITNKELSRAKQAMSGNWKVSLADSRGVADVLIAVLEIGRDLSFIDEYPKIIESLTLKEVNQAIKKYIDPKKFVTVAAGSIEK